MSLRRWVRHKTQAHLEVFQHAYKRATDQMNHSIPSSKGSGMCLRYADGGKMSDKNLEQKTNIKFCVQIGKSASETLALLTLAYGEYAM
jgi:hypothetical protein